MDARLVRPSRKYFGQFQHAVSDDFARQATAQSYIAEMRRAARGRSTGVARTEFWLIVDELYAGRIQLRHRPSARHPTMASHIYYEIIPSQRKRGLGQLLLRLGLRKAAAIGIDPVLIACDDKNIASRKIIERNGGKAVRIANLPEGRMRLYIVNAATRAEARAA